MKLSNILNIETRPFDPATYEPAEEEAVVDESGKRRVRLRDQNVIRWRVRPGGADGAPAIESNARSVCAWRPTCCVTHAGPYQSPTLFILTHIGIQQFSMLRDHSWQGMSTVGRRNDLVT